MDVKLTNQKLKNKEPSEIITWVLSLKKKTIVTTNFGPYEAVILDMVVKEKNNVDVIWIDSGYNTRATYIYAEKLIKLLNLNLHTYIPLVSAKRRDTLMNGIPEINSPLHEEFTNQVKLEPFRRAMKDFMPEIWLTAIRKEQTAFRKNLDIVTMDEKGITKVAPLFYFDEQYLKNYLAENSLPDEQDYYDPTKVLNNRECGLHKL